ncbi:restriction endonuclease subunit S [Mammaliicoccus lentus]|uniref:restriction endonuclease subunit S n=1 Tax=Mammaliicoccus lentus TaxID=42858 RepID=UPI003D13940B
MFTTVNFYGIFFVVIQNFKEVENIEPIIKYHSGTILNRLKSVDRDIGKRYVIYDQNMMDFDLGKFNYNYPEPKVLILKEDNNAKYIYRDQIVFNMITGECVLVGDESSGAILPYNYTHIEVDEDKVYPRYLVYWFNHSPKALKQINLFKQGGSLIKKITHKQLQDMEIPLPTMEKQKLIGDLTHKRKKLKYLKEKRENLMDAYLVERLLREE